MGHLTSEKMAFPLEGTVLTVFRSSFYLNFGKLIFCIGTRELPLGPLNISTSASPEINWEELGVRKNVPAKRLKEHIRIGCKYLFIVSGAHEWSPDQIRKPLYNAALERGLATFKEKALKMAPDECLWRFICGGSLSKNANIIGQVTRRNISEARQWLTQALIDKNNAEAMKIDWAKKLVGLGYGLTPSGDDFLGGIMIALHSIGKGDLSYLLWSKIQNHVSSSTNLISIAHMRAASNGIGADVIHRAISTIADGDLKAIEGSILGVDCIGHTSGWDIISGSIVVLESWLYANNKKAAWG